MAASSGSWQSATRGRRAQGVAGEKPNGRRAARYGPIPGRVWVVTRARGSWYRSRGRPFSIPSRSVMCAVQRPGCYVHTAYPRAIPDGVARADRRSDCITHPDSDATDRRFLMSTNQCYLIQSWCFGTGICCTSSEAERRYTQRSAAGYHWLRQENLQCCRLSASMITPSAGSAGAGLAPAPAEASGDP